MRKPAIIFTLFSLLTTCVQAVENSIVPVMDRYEQVENLQVEKYSSNQYAEIVWALRHKEEKIRIASWCVDFKTTDILPMLQEMNADIFCIQELNPDCLNDFLEGLGEDFALFADPQGEEITINGIFYRKDRFEVLEGVTWILPSEEDRTGPETLTVLKLEDQRNGNRFAVFNTRLTFSHADLREEQALFVIERVEEAKEEMTILFAGSLNRFANRPDLAELPFYDGDYLYRLFTRTLIDTRETAVLGHIGPIVSTEEWAPGVILDCILATSGVQPLIHAIQPATIQGVYSAEHKPLITDLYIPRCPCSN